MGRHKTARNVEIRPWLSRNADGKEGRFVQVGNSLLLSKEFQTLTSGARLLYLCMTMESGGKREFTFTHGAGKKYGVAPSSYDRYVKDLQERKFIERLEDTDTAPQYAPGKYRFCFDWKTSTSIE